MPIDCDKELHRHATMRHQEGKHISRPTHSSSILHSQHRGICKLTSEDRQPLGESGNNLVSSCASGAANGGTWASSSSSSKRRRCEVGEGGTGPSLEGRRGVAFPRLWWKCSWLRKQPVPVWAGFRPLADSPSVLLPSACDRLCPVRRLKAVVRG